MTQQIFGSVEATHVVEAIFFEPNILPILIFFKKLTSNYMFFICQAFLSFPLKLKLVQNLLELLLALEIFFNSILLICLSRKVNKKSVRAI